MNALTFKFGRERFDDRKFNKRYFPFIERLGKRRYGWRGKIYFRTASQAEGYARRWAERADRFLYNKNGSNVNALTQEVDHANKN